MMKKMVSTTAIRFVTTHGVFKLKSENHVRLSSPFVVLSFNRMQQCAQTKDPENVCQRNTEVLSTPLPFSRTLLVSTFSSTLLSTWEAGLAKLTRKAYKKA